MLTDLRYSLRVLAAAPGFTAVAVFILAVGIGGTSAVFGLFRAVFLSPLPFPEADRLVTVVERRGGSRNANIPVSGHEYAAWREQNRVFSGVALHRPEILHVTGAGEPESVEAIRTSVEFFPVLGMRPALGRFFSPGEDRAGGARLAVLSDAFWRRRFGADAAVLGQPLILNDQAFTVVGVLPPLPESLSADVWLPLDVPAQIRAVGRHNLSVFARLAPGISSEEAQADLQAISEQLARQMPDANTDHHAQVLGLREQMVGEYRFALVLLLSAAGFVLLIACANLANLLLTRSAGRQSEMAIRTAIGAGRTRLVRQLLVESLLIGLIGGAGGLLVAIWIVDLLPALVVSDIPLLETSRVDWTVIAVCGALSLLTGMAIGIAPALRASRPDIQRFLTTGRGTSEDRGGRRLRSVLVAAELAWTLVLLVGAGLMLNSFVRLLHVRPGFDSENVVVVPIDLFGARYGDAARRRAFYDDLIARLRSLPGVEAAGAVSHLPLGGADNWMPFALPGRPSPAPGQELYAAFRVATPDYFRTLRIPLRAGRFFTEADSRLAVPVIRWFPQQPLPPDADRPQPQPAALISEAAARQFWPDEDPVGKRIRVLFSPEMTIVGVVGDIKHNALNLPAYPHVYLPHNQEPWNSASFVVRTTIPPQQAIGAIREQVRAIDAGLPVTARLLDDVRVGTIAQQRFYALLVGLFGIVALALAVIGIYGVVSFATAERRTEIGVRLALGAQRGEILGLIIAQALPSIAAGVGLGVVGAFALSGLVETLLYGVEPVDPLTFGAAAALLAAVALAACWVPARRAARLDPVLALRSQ